MNDMLVDESDPVPPPAAFVPRPEQAAQLAAALAAVRMTEGERRWSNVVTQLSGWMVAALMVVPLGYSISLLKNRPMPQDHIWVAIQHSDGSTEPAKPIEDQTPSERENTITSFIYDYVDSRMSYDWEHLKRNYDRTKFMTAPGAQREYTDAMVNSPDRPTETMGKLGERRLSNIAPVRSGDTSFEVTYTEMIRTKEGIWLPERNRRARISYATSTDMPTEIARRYDPLKLVVTRFYEFPANYDPTAPGGAK